MFNCWEVILKILAVSLKMKQTNSFLLLYRFHLWQTYSIHLLCLQMKTVFILIHWELAVSHNGTCTTESQNCGSREDHGPDTGHGP